MYSPPPVEMEILTVVPESTRSTYSSPFLRDFIHLNVAMMTSNNALVPDPDKQDDLASKAWQWPILNVGLRMCGWDDKSMIPDFDRSNFQPSSTICSEILSILGPPRSVSVSLASLR